MSLTPEQQRKVIDYYFTEPNAKAVCEDEDIGASIQDVRDFLKDVYQFLIKLHPGDEEREPEEVRKPGDVGIGISATTEDMKVLYGQ